MSRGLIGSSFGLGLGHRRFRAGIYYPPMHTTADTSATLTQSAEYAVRFDIGETASFDRMGLEVITAVAGTAIRLGIRKDTGECYPSDLLTEIGSIDSTTTGFKEIIIAQTLPPGRYWLTSVSQGAAGVVVRARGLDPILGQTATGGSNVAAVFQSGVTGPLPTAFSSAYSTSVNGPKILMRAA